MGATVALWGPWLLVPVVIVWGYNTGIAVSLGQRQSVAVVQGPVALLVAAGLPLAAGPAAVRALLVLAGGLFQVVLVASSWMVRPGARERAALGETFTGLARYATDVAAGALRAPTPARFAAEEVLADPNPLVPADAELIFVDILEHAERTRAAIAALAARAAASDPEVAGQIRSLAVSWPMCCG